jgi:hypothetical protein
MGTVRVPRRNLDESWSTLLWISNGRYFFVQLIPTVYLLSLFFVLQELLYTGVDDGMTYKEI